MPLTFKASHTSFPILDGSTKSILAVKINPLKGLQVNDQERRSFHLALLLDMSGSMNGDRLESVKTTMHLLVDEMTHNDRITIIEYASYALCKQKAIMIQQDTKTSLHHYIDSMTASGGTNMECALSCLNDTIHTDGFPKLDALFIMTDGHVNEGILSTKGLQRIINATLPVGTPVNTLGYGADHNSRMLREMAIHSRGSYTFADNAEMLPIIIGNIAGGLMSEIGRNGTIKIPNGWKCIEMGATPEDIFHCGIFIDQKPQWIVLESEPEVEIPSILTLDWNESDDKLSANIHVNNTLDQNVILEQYIRTACASVLSQVSEHIETCEYEHAHRKLNELMDYMNASAVGHTFFIMRLKAQIDDMRQMISVIPRTHMNQTLVTPPTPLPRMQGTHFHPIYHSHTETIQNPDIQTIMSRLSSDATALGTQNGFLYGNDPTTPDTTFSSPLQRNMSADMRREFRNRRN